MTTPKLHHLSAFLGLVFLSAVSGLATPRALEERSADNSKVLILGGGVCCPLLKFFEFFLIVPCQVAGIIAARTFHEQGYDNFVIVEARDELGGRLMSHTFGAAGNQHTVELGANWVQGPDSFLSGRRLVS